MATLIVSSVLLEDFTLSFHNLVPFVTFGFLSEMLKFSAYSINEQKFNISAGSAIIFAAIILFNPLELVVFAFFYGISIVVFPLVKDIYKFLFNISQTVNVTYFSYLVWNYLYTGNNSLLNSENSVGLLNSKNVIPLFLCLATFVIIDLIAVLAIISFASGGKFSKIMRNSLDWVFASYVLYAFMGILLAVVYKEFYIYGLLGFIIPLFLMHYNMQLFSKEKEKQVNQLHIYNEMLKTNNEELLITLSQVIDARDNSLFGHSVSVAKYAVEIGKRLELSDEQLYDLNRSSLIHDIGKLGISENILQKPGKLTDAEFEIIKTHTLIGEQIINKTKGMERVAKIIGQHHEHFNGKGYPFNLKGEEIMIESRIVTLCDSVETMLSTRSYKECRPLEDVVEEVKRCSGSHFDPQIASIFIELAQEKGTEFFYNSAESDHDLELKNLLIRQLR
jgi:putative nucleotidyltransferase with HDIG domain